jgi:hypothetical protein
LHVVSGSDALAYFERHLAVVLHVDRLSALLARCPDTGTVWFVLDSTEPESLDRGVVLARVADPVTVAAEPTYGSLGYL